MKLVKESPNGIRKLVENILYHEITKYNEELIIKAIELWVHSQTS
jgi:hypothetical protein